MIAYIERAVKRGDARHLIERIGVMRRPCDLDLLIFFVRHSSSLLASESLASFLGYDLKEIAESLDVLLEAGLITRTQTSAHAARLYVLAIDSTDGGGDTHPSWLPPLLALASTREGRLALREALTHPRREDRSTLGPRRIVPDSTPRSTHG
jgi:hypothetical protein